jgi:SAM-dependent methyltransferase
MSEAMPVPVLPAESHEASYTLDFAPIGRGGIEEDRVHAVLQALPDTNYARAVQFGAHQSELTAKLAARCGQFVLQDGAGTGLDGAPCDLVILADVLGVWDDARLARVCAEMLDALAPGGHCVLMNWLHDGIGDAAAERLIAAAGEALLPILRRRMPLYRIDVLERA